MTALSICIPTSHGRAETLVEAVESVLVQLTPDLRQRVEICISDNAPEDRTEELVDDWCAEHGELFRYHQNQRDMGIPFNILKSVEIAHGGWCWLLGSDDVLAPGGLATMFSLLERYPDTAGFSVAVAILDRGMERFIGVPSALWPSRPDMTRALEGAETILAECGLSFGGISNIVVDRRGWLEAVSALGGRERIAGDRSLASQAQVLGAVVNRHPKWVWCADRLVHVRSGNSSLEADLGWDPTRVLTEAIPDLDRALAAAVGDRSAVHRLLLEKLYLACATPQWIRQAKLLPSHRWRSDLRLLLCFTRLFAGFATFWCRSFPLLVVPHPLFKLMRRAGGQRPPLGGP